MLESWGLPSRPSSSVCCCCPLQWTSCAVSRLPHSRTLPLRISVQWEHLAYMQAVHFFPAIYKTFLLLSTVSYIPRVLFLTSRRSVMAPCLDQMNASNLYPKAQANSGQRSFQRDIWVITLSVHFATNQHAYKITE